MTESDDTTYCTCGPYPIIDLTPAFDVTTSDQRKLMKLQREVKAACERFGCFHVIINAESTAFNDNTATTSTTNAKGAACLCDLAHEKGVIDLIESLFEDHFILSQVKGRYGSDDKVASVPFRSKDDNHFMAKYRGRSAESGSVSLLQLNDSHLEVDGEPKQSWEFFRCSRVLPSQTENILTKEEADGLSRLKIVQGYTNILHSVAEMIFSPLILNLPSETFIAASGCQCSNDSETHQESSPYSPPTSSTNCKEKSCSIDLLRVFRYDALNSSEEQDTNLGSSPHTDWGSLTVVWQDSIGGLQIHCDMHDCWNDVTVEPHNPSCHNDAKDCNVKKVIRLFIHVGDFLSLALSGARKESARLDARNVKYPSPMHRVICPKRDLKNKDDEGAEAGERAKNPRCSLVYFAYPPPGLSLQNAQSSVFREGCVNDNMGNMADLSDGYPKFPFDRFMLLHNQSIDSSTLVKDQMYQHVSDRTANDYRKSRAYYNYIRSLPFDSVIREKWDQVQR